MRKIWNVAIYARVSTDKKEQQESIPAQVQGLKKWLIEKSKVDVENVYNLVEVYEDAGFSGSNFDRDSFIRMKEDIEQGKINMVLTRDLSRFSRNYITAGYYLEDYFKVNGVRFISVLDNVDTLEEFNDIVPFKNILNEMYIKDCSRRTRDGLKQRMLRGSCIASKPLYGYKFETEMSGNIKTIKLVPAEDETTQIIRDIFDLYIKGWGMSKIATHLNGNGVLPPSARINFSLAKFGLWTPNAIRYILKNPKYGGIMAQQMWKKLSYKVKKVKATQQDEWIVGCEFEGIIDKNTFQEVQNMIIKRGKNFRHKGEIHLFSSILKCNECSGSMSYRKKYQGYKCTNSQIGGGRCSAHSIKEEELKGIIICDLKQYVDDKINKQDVYDLIDKKISKEEDYDKKLKKIENELKKLDKQFEELYMDKLNEKLSQRNFEVLSKSIEKKQDELINKKNELLSKICMTNTYNSEYEFYKNEIDRILNFQEFDRMMVEKLIDKIVVLEDKKTKEKSVDIFYKFEV